MSNAPAPRHLVTVWNPSYSDSAMDAHLAVLLRGPDTADGGDDGEESRYVWWAKLRSPNRQQPLPHISEILSIQEQIDAETETHLYLTDYRSLYVGQVEEITDDDPRDEYPEEAERMPGYYAGRDADLWFQLADLRLLVADDTVAVVEELQNLRNQRYHDRPVSL